MQVLLSHSSCVLFQRLVLQILVQSRRETFSRQTNFDHQLALLRHLDMYDVTVLAVSVTHSASSEPNYHLVGHVFHYRGQHEVEHDVTVPRDHVTLHRGRFEQLQQKSRNSFCPDFLSAFGLPGVGPSHQPHVLQIASMNETASPHFHPAKGALFVAGLG